MHVDGTHYIMIKYWREIKLEIFFIRQTAKFSSYVMVSQISVLHQLKSQAVQVTCGIYMYSLMTTKTSKQGVYYESPIVHIHLIQLLNSLV